MDQPWYRNLFHRRQTEQPQTPEAKAHEGDAAAQFSVGQGFDHGDGEPADDGQALAWYRKAACQDHAPAQFNLGMMLTGGRGATRDDTEARQWILLAAQQGHAAAQHALGVRFRRDSFNGAPADAAEANLEAYKWFGLAAAQGHGSSVGELENLAVRLTSEQVSEGEQRMARFVARASAPKSAQEPCSPDPEV